MTPKASYFQRPFERLPAELDKDDRPQALQSSRSVTAPPVLSFATSPPSKNRVQSPSRYSTIPESDSDFSSSVESFHSVQSWHSPLAPPSPPASEPSSPTYASCPYPHNKIQLASRLMQTRDNSELKAALDTSQPTTRSSSPSPKPSILASDSAIELEGGNNQEVAMSIITKPTIRHRATTSSNSRRRTLSPLPPAVNLFSPPRRRPRHLHAVARYLPAAIIQKTCEILLSPPSHLFHLMLSIASKIAAGEWTGMLAGYGEAVHWDFEDEYAGESSYEDDYGISLLGSNSRNKNTNTESSGSNSSTGGSWEVD